MEEAAAAHRAVVNVVHRPTARARGSSARRSRRPLGRGPVASSPPSREGAAATRAAATPASGEGHLTAREEEKRDREDARDHGVCTSVFR